MLSEWKRTCSLPQSEEVGSVISVLYSCSLVCLTKLTHPTGKDG